MKALLIAPLPPPVTGNSLAVRIFLDELQKSYQIEAVNLSKNNFQSGVASFGRIKQIFRLLKEVRKKKKDADVIYFTISQSVAGNLKDMLIYLISYRKLHRMVIHLHGGPGMRNIMMNKSSLLYKLNRFFIKRLGGVIVLGQSHLDIYDGVLEKEKLHIVPNFAEDYLFLSQEEIQHKFRQTNPIRILFLSNLIEGKGHIELADSYIALSEDMKRKVIIDFAGGFESEMKKKEFLDKIHPFEGLNYNGIVSGTAKRDAFKKAHIFCLPTYYQYEGQPISILEAYATGCAVITTNHSGIKDVFKNKLNGFEVEPKSVDSLRNLITQVVSESGSLMSIALANHQIAVDHYRTSNYNASLMKIIHDMHS